MKLLSNKSTKSIQVKSNGRSADITSPNFIYGCNGSCEYCYMKRHNTDKIFVYNQSTINKMIENIHKWGDQQSFPKTPNHIHKQYYLVDIGNACDIPLQYKYQNWSYIVNKITSHPKLGITFATTYPSSNLIDWSNELGIYNKIRVRITLMPQVYSNIVEPNGESIESRIKMIDILRNLGWDVRYSFAPIIYTDNWLEQYKKLFNMLPNYGEAECIFLTTTPKQKDIPLLYPEELLEWKQTTHGGKVMRYKWYLKKDMIQQFKELLNHELPNVKISYIF